MLGASVHPAVHLLGGSTNVVRTLKVAGRDQVMQIMDYLDNMEEEFHKFYPPRSLPDGRRLQGELRKVCDRILGSRVG